MLYSQSKIFKTFRMPTDCLLLWKINIFPTLLFLNTIYVCTLKPTQNFQIMLRSRYDMGKLNSVMESLAKATNA
jgi:hypothetical protein